MYLHIWLNVLKFKIKEIQQTDELGAVFCVPALAGVLAGNHILQDISAAGNRADADIHAVVVAARCCWRPSCAGVPAVGRVHDVVWLCCCKRTVLFVSQKSLLLAFSMLLLPV